MVERNDHVVADALELVAQALHGNNLPSFKGKYDLDGAQMWLRENEKLFRVMTCTEEHKVLFGTHTLFEEAEDWWDNVCQRLKVIGDEITWAVFGVKFLEKLPKLVNKCRIYDKDCRACSAHYKSVSERKGNNKYREKSYSAPANKGKHRATDEKSPSGGETPASTKCFKCDKLGHRANECKNKFLRCFKC
ncbi:uncharacterized protein LOC127093882 [Lathyrus oleraceus]|uniref:uncharacterized protein LOC127093882 n=1 Tax=Pisum sativum TaxID=3888 RepID=UPI0021D10E95|nr:uncharacterized protein LOC127093882 [Pisum sativum]